MAIPSLRSRPENPAWQHRSVGFNLLSLSCSALDGINRASGLLRDRVHLRRSIRYLFRLRPGDIFIVSFPKSGTTLMQMMLYQLTTSGEMDFPHIDSVSPWFEAHLQQGDVKGLELSSPRFFKSHLPYGQLPRGARYIYLARDVRDVAVSAYHHSQLVGGRSLDLTWYLDRFLAGHTIFGSWFEHLESWWPHRDDDDVLFLRFEDMVADLEGTARRVAEFCGFEIRDDVMPRLRERCSVAFMRQHEEKFDPRRLQSTRRPVAFIRKGKPGEGKDAFNPAQKRLLAGKLAALANTLGVSAQDQRAELLRLRVSD